MTSNDVGSQPTLRSESSVIRARFRMALPENTWIAAVSTSFPNTTFRLLTGVPAGDRALELGEVRGENVGAAADAIRQHPDITAYEDLHADERRIIAQYEAIEQSLYEFLWQSSLPPEFPIVVGNGDMEFELTATQAQFDAFGTALDDSGRQYELLTLVHTDDDDRLLTERQHECLRLAQQQGYFAVPRECTLAELAEVIGVDTSTASETIRRGTARIVEQFLLQRT